MALQLFQRAHRQCGSTLRTGVIKSTRRLGICDIARHVDNTSNSYHSRPNSLRTQV